MMKSMFVSMMAFVLLGCSFLTGCAGYTCGSKVPQDLRTVHVAAFENNTIYPMAGALVTQHLMRAMVEDGTFTLDTFESAPLRVHGKVSGLDTRSLRYDRNNRIVPNEYRVELTATIYVYDTRTGEMLLNGQPVTAQGHFLTRNDYTTGMMDVLPSLSAQLSQRILEQLQTLGEGKAPAPVATSKVEPISEEML